MANYRRAKLAADAFRSFTSRIVTRAEPVSRVYSTKFSTLASNAAKLSSSYSILHRSTPHRHLNPFLGFSERYYCVDRRQVQHFRQRGPRRLVDWFKSKCRVFVFTVNYSLETVPYTKRRHFVRLSPSREKKLGEARLEELKAGFKGKFLPATHPKSLRVRLVANNIIGALQTRLRHDEGQDGGVKEATSHLVDLNWEVLVVDEPIGDAVCLPGGKIVFFTGLLKDFGSDAEIATIIGHEVGHAVARHHAEGVLWIEILRVLLFPFSPPEIFHSLSLYFLRQRIELEADHIELLLMASAGYDPRVVPTVYEKMGKIADGDSVVRDPNYPSGKKRAEMLARANVMEEALTLYRNARVGTNYRNRH
ncbi:hypothetical protein M0R45_037931 [Rubus argutus]|uniref:Peptidase M48 domain-containing protein n=1 Tax=Rubus argutus TaxID=59490 RepID=A0AAW1W4Z8_RUBAR